MIPNLPRLAVVLCASVLSLRFAMPLLIAAPPAVEIASIVELFEYDAPLEVSQVPYVRKQSTVVPSRLYSERKMGRIGLRMTSQTYRGLKCEHDVTVYLPLGELAQPPAGTAAIILGGAGIRAEDAKLDWLESIVLGLNIPCVVVEQALDAKQFNVRNPGQLMSMGNQRYMESGDPREAGYYALAKIFSAAATIAEHLPEVQAQRCVVTGSSKGGMAALIACAGDPRIVGAFPTAWNSGDVIGFTRLKGERWGWDVRPKQTGPAGQTARQSLSIMDSPNGRKYIELFDPAQWGDLLKDKFIMPAVGTNDPLFHLLSDSNYFDELKCRKAFLRIPNYPHGRKHALHALGWRVAVSAALMGSSIPSVHLGSKADGDHVTLTAELGDGVDNARIVLWRTSDGVGDYRRAKWTRQQTVELNGQADRIRIAQVAVPLSGTAAYFLQLQGTSGEAPFINSSNVVELAVPAKRAQSTNE